MAAQILDGKALAQRIQGELKDTIAQLRSESVRSGKVGSQGDRPPGLAVLMVGDDPASAAYVRNKERACDRLGIASLGQHFPASTSQAELTDTIHALNADPNVDGILVQLPLPGDLDSDALLREIDPDKDADGLHPENLGRLLRGDPGLRSCTPAGVMKLLAETGVNLSGKRAVVVGRSILVGKPLALMLLEANATVTIAHSRTADLPELLRSADIVVAAVGKPGMIDGSMVAPGAIAIDVGINRVTAADGKSRLVGDLDYDSVRSQASWITPVPGGVGPMTVTLLMANTVQSYRQRLGL